MFGRKGRSRQLLSQVAEMWSGSTLFLRSRRTWAASGTRRLAGAKPRSYQLVKEGHSCSARPRTTAPPSGSFPNRYYMDCGLVVSLLSGGGVIQQGRGTVEAAREKRGRSGPSPGSRWPREVFIPSALDDAGSPLLFDDPSPNRCLKSQVMFEDVAVYFSPAEWAELAEWQRDLYRAVMVENYEAIASLGHLSVKPEVIRKIEQAEEPCMDEPLQPPTWKRPQSPWLGDGIRLEEEEEEGEKRAGLADWRRRRRQQHPAQRKRKKQRSAPGSQKPVTRARSALPKAKGAPLPAPRVTLKMNPPKCPECGKSFLSNVAMTIHIRTHTGERPFKCHLCPKGFPSHGDLKRHLKTHLRQKDPAPGASSAPRSKKCLTAKLQLLRQLGAAPGPKKPHTCGQCGKSFNKRQDLRKHQGTHSTERPFSCLQCGRSFRLKQILVAHMKVHGGERPYSCAQCGKRFGQKHHVESHQRVHTGEKPFSCTTCGKRYAQKQPLISHLRVHTGERPYACAECGKTFRNQATLTIHNRMHTGERPYRCLLCGKTCSQLQHLKSHQRVHRAEQHLLLAGDSKALALKRAREMEEKPYPCPRCEKRFRDEKIMQTHLKTHEEKAALSGAAGPGPSRGPPLSVRPDKSPPREPKPASRGTGRLRAKQRSPAAAAAAGRRSVACTDCGRKFTQPKYLTMHRRSHT